MIFGTYSEIQILLFENKIIYFSSQFCFNKTGKNFVLILIKNKLLPNLVLYFVWLNAQKHSPVEGV